MPHHKDDETPMTALIRSTSDLSAARPLPDDPRVEKARSTMQNELDANLQMLDQLATSLADAEEDVRQALDGLQRAVERRNERAETYNAGVRNFGRMLGSVAQVRAHLGDAQDRVVEALEYALPEVDSWPTVEWPEDEWPDSDLVEPEGFDLEAIVGRDLRRGVCVYCDLDLVWIEGSEDAPLQADDGSVLCLECAGEVSS